MPFQSTIRMDYKPTPTPEPPHKPSCWPWVVAGFFIGSAFVFIYHAFGG